MTKLAQILEQQIRTSGPLSLAEYMQICLLHPQYGYYTTRDPLGTTGDFTTAPEISQMFGELTGLALAQAWMDRGAPNFRLVELGPGRGTLMSDLLRATAKVPGFHDAMTLHLVEASPVLRNTQKQTISHELTHHESLEDVPEGPIFLVANEFFDALPIRQFQRDKDAWRERIVGLDQGCLSLGLSDPMCPQVLQPRLEDTEDGDIVEVSSSAQTIAATIGARIEKQGGVALILDYGDWRSLGDTFQGLRQHKNIPPLTDPGTADLTAHVDFEAIATAAAPALYTRLTPQGVFLERLGLTARAQKLAESLSGDALESHIAAHRRLTHPEEMGTLFKAIALYQQGSPLPPGFVE